MLERYLSEARLAARGLLRSPVYLLAAVVTLSLGIGANALVYTLANAIFLKPLPFARGDELVNLSVTYQAPNGNVVDYWGAPLDYLAMASRSKTLTGAGAMIGQTLALTGERDPETIQGGKVSAALWTVLGTRPVAGRTYGESDDVPNGTVAVISETLQQRLFPGIAQGAVGKSIVLDGQPRTVVAVMPRGFGPALVPGDAWVPLGISAATATDIATRQLIMIGRRRADVSVAQAKSDMVRIAKELERELPVTHKGWSANAGDLRTTVGGTARPLALTLMAAVGFLLLLACANVANLALARVARRKAEVSTRMALGASRAAIVRQQMLEAVVLGLGAGITGGAIAAGALPPLLRLTGGAANNALLGLVQFDWRVAVIVLLLSVITGVACSIMPSVYGVKVAGGGPLAGGGRRQQSGIGERRLRRSLMATQVTVAAVLLVGSLGVVGALRRLAATKVGFDGTQVAVAKLTLPDSRYSRLAERSAFVTQVFEQLGAVPGIVSAGVTNNRFIRGQNQQTLVTVEGRPSPTGEPYATDLRRIAGGYFRTLGVAVQRGRDFTAADRDSTLPVTIVSQAFVKRYFADVDPLGQRITRGGRNPWLTIVGVVPDVMDAGVGVELGPTVYIPYTQNAAALVTLIVKSRLGLPETTRAIAAAVHAVDPNQPIDNVTPMPRLLTDSLGEPRFKAVLLSVLSVLALLLACTGIYGVTAYLVAERTREIAIRMALGAAPRGVLRHLVGEGTRWIAGGATAGLLLAWGLAGLVGAKVPEVASTGLTTYLMTGLLLTAVGVVATTFPTLRAMHVPAAEVLRGD